MARIEDGLTDVELNRIYQLSIMANVLNCWDFFLDKEQISNDQLMKALELQNKNYLKEILENQRLIIKELSELKERL